MMRLQFSVTYLDGRKVTVTSRPATEVAFERRFERTVGSLFVDLSFQSDASEEQKAHILRTFMSSMRSDYLYFLAWHSSKSEKEYDEWLEMVDSIEWDVADAADPTSPAAPAGS
jgi:hypothetical protein